MPISPKPKKKLVRAKCTSRNGKMANKVIVMGFDVDPISIWHFKLPLN
mgnify:CR=1 FL=1